MSRTTIQTVLTMMRERFGMDAAFVSEFTNGTRVFRYVDTATSDVPIRVGKFDALEESYCQLVVDGRLPEYIHDAHANPVAMSLAATTELPVGTHLSVPIRTQNGRLFGTLCCFSRAVRDDVKESDLALMRPLAEFVGALLEREDAENAESAAARARIEHVLRTGGPTMVFQPIVHIGSRVPAGYEALARFRDRRGPDVWFREAWQVGLGSDLEVLAVANALKDFTASGLDGYVSVNLSPASLEFVETVDSLAVLASDRLVIEITEHAAVRDPRLLSDRLAEFRAGGGRLAIDDMGTGYSGLSHLIELSPDLIKLDRSLVTGIAPGNARHALVRSLVTFCCDVGTTIVAEGVETEEEDAILHDIGVPFAQGYLYARPGPLTRHAALVS